MRVPCQFIYLDKILINQHSIDDHKQQRQFLAGKLPLNICIARLARQLFFPPCNGTVASSFARSSLEHSLAKESGLGRYFLRLNSSIGQR
jgi:hypothetical protein